MRNEVVMDQSIPFHKPNKKMSEKMMDHPTPQTKWTQKTSYRILADYICVEYKIWKYDVAVISSVFQTFLTWLANLIQILKSLREFWLLPM